MWYLIPFWGPTNIDDKRANPARLAEILQGNPQFSEIGYMIANER